jgi:DNA-binding transcriptional MerR regulator
MENKYLIKQVSRISGVTLRTLRHYDNIGLLKPSRQDENRYREYTDSDLDKLQQILLYKELGLDLVSIINILHKPGFSAAEALKDHSSQLAAKIARLQEIRNLVNNQINFINKGKTMKNEDKFKALNIKAINDHEQRYAEETQAKYGHTDAYKESQKRYKKYSDAEKLAILQKGNEIYQEIADNMNLDPADPKIQALVAKWQQHITDNFYPCTNEILAGLGEIYITDQRFQKNIDKTKTGLAEFISRAIRIYVK